MKMIRLFAMALLVGVAVETKAQFGPQQDPDSKYATELIKPGTVAPDFKMLKPDGNTTFSAESERLSAFLCNFAAENEYTYIIR